MTPAIEMLRAAGVDHEVFDYEHDPTHPSYAEEAVEALGVDPESVFKTLMVEFEDASFAIGVVPVQAMLDVKAIARAAGHKRATMAPPGVAERRSGYVVGGISPFGQKRPVPTFVDEWATTLDLLYCSAGRRGLEVAVAPSALVDVLDATFAPIAGW